MQLLTAIVLLWVVVRDGRLEAHLFVRLHVYGHAFKDVLRWGPQGRRHRIELYRGRKLALRLTVEV